MALGRLFTIAANFTDPNAYFVGGGVVEAAPHFREWFLAKIREHTLLRDEQAAVAEFSLVPDRDMAGARGAADRRRRDTGQALAGSYICCMADLLPGREVPIGKYTTVQRMLPHRERRTVGAWCFLDHFGPQSVINMPGMQVPPHPHMGLQTVTWLLDGEVLHRDSLGSLRTIHPGQLNLMTSGHGIAHSEESPTDHPPSLHGLQLWVALPSGSREGPARFDHYPELPRRSVDGGALTVVMGEFDGLASPRGDLLAAGRRRPGPRPRRVDRAGPAPGLRIRRGHHGRLGRRRRHRPCTPTASSTSVKAGLLQWYERSPADRGCSWSAASRSTRSW